MGSAGRSPCLCVVEAASARDFHVDDRAGEDDPPTVAELQLELGNGELVGVVDVLGAVRLQPANRLDVLAGGVHLVSDGLHHLIRERGALLALDILFHVNAVTCFCHLAPPCGSWRRRLPVGSTSESWAPTTRNRSGPGTRTRRPGCRRS